MLWAKSKDDNLNSQLQNKAESRRREKERKEVNASLRKESAEKAYNCWALKQPQPILKPPSACKQRQETISQLQRPNTCIPCISRTRKHSASQMNPRVLSPIKVSMHQVKRNIESTGKPDKMHPYTNYPPQKRTTSSKGGRSRSGRSSQTTKPSTATSIPAPPHISICVDNYTEHDQQPLSEQNAKSAAECVNEQSDLQDSGTLTQIDHESCTPEPTPQQPAEEQTEVEVQFLIGGMEEEEELAKEEEIIFHDVGKTNTVDALALELLRQGSKNLSRSLSHPRNRRFSFSLHERRFSLSAIPEGQIVTNYSNDSFSNIAGTSEGEPLAWGQEENEDGDLKQSIEERLSICSKEEREERECDESVSTTNHLTVENIPAHQVLNIVNFAWDAASNNVHTIVTKTPMIPANHLLQSHTHHSRLATSPLSRLTPKHAQMKLHSSFQDATPSTAHSRTAVPPSLESSPCPATVDDNMAGEREDRPPEIDHGPSFVLPTTEPEDVQDIDNNQSSPTEPVSMKPNILTSKISLYFLFCFVFVAMIQGFLSHCLLMCYFSPPAKATSCLLPCTLSV